jgi:hypothetical protein
MHVHAYMYMASQILKRDEWEDQSSVHVFTYMHTYIRTYVCAGNAGDEGELDRKIGAQCMNMLLELQVCIHVHAHMHVFMVARLYK